MLLSCSIFTHARTMTRQASDQSAILSCCYRQSVILLSPLPPAALRIRQQTNVSIRQHMSADTTRGLYPADPFFSCMKSREISRS